MRAIFETGATTSKEEILKALPEAIPALFHPDAEWIEAPEPVDSTTYRGHDGIRDSFERWLEQWDDYRFEAERIEDHGDRVLVVAREAGEGHAPELRRRQPSSRCSRFARARSVATASSTTRQPPERHSPRVPSAVYPLSHAMSEENVELVRKAFQGSDLVEVARTYWHPEIVYVEDPRWPGAARYEGREAGSDVFRPTWRP